MYEAVDVNAISQPAGVQSNGTTSLLPPTPAAVPCGGSGPTGGEVQQRLLRLEVPSWRRFGVCPDRTARVLSERVLC